MHRIGVFVCHCGLNIAGVIDVKKVVEEIAKHPDVIHAEDYIYMCSDPGQKRVEEAIKEYNLDGVIVANCSPTLHELTFRNAAVKAGLNPYRVEIANIREQCSWPHEENKETATRKAIKIIKATIEKLKLDSALVPISIPVTKRALVIGGGITGIQVALDIADAGYEVILVEKTPSIGGRMIQLSETFPTLDCPQCIETPKMVSVEHHPNIKLYTYSEVESVSGYIGNFDVKIRRKSPYVDYEKCKGCGDCAEVCPVEIPNDFDRNLSLKKAIYRPFAQAVPNVFTIEKRGWSPCRARCPVHLNAHGYIAAARAGRFDRGIEIIRKDGEFPFAGVAGRICTHPCEEVCDRGNVDKPVMIKYIKRFLADWEIREKKEITYIPQVTEERKEKVTIIGAGPAGLMAAYDLRRYGFQVEVIDALPEPGGVLLIGIPEYRLPKDVLRREVDVIKRMGVKFRMNTRVGKDVSFREIVESSDAVFIGAGAHRERRMNVEGEELEGVISALDFLKKVNLKEEVEIGEKVYVVGGGNSAIDAARTAKRLGRDVKIVYRRSINEMPAIREEIEAALEEGIEILFLTNPVRFIGRDGKLERMVLIRMELGEPDESGRRRPIPIEGSEYEVECDTVILAIGEKPDLSFLDMDIDLTPWGTIKVDELTLQTSIEKVFAGGDVVRGPSTFIDAAGDGRRAAESIRKYLNGEDLRLNREYPLPYNSGFKGQRDIAYRRDRGEMPIISMDERLNSFKEVERGLDEEQAVEEARRCINCAVCSECKLCVEVCEPKAIFHDMEDEIVEEKVGAIVVATGFDLMPLEKLPEYGGGKVPDVIDALQFERILSASGPTAGEVRRPSDGKVPKEVVFVSCAGSRDPEHGVPYCSRICCMYLAKQALLYKHAVHDGQAYNFYIDIRSNGKGYEEFVQRVMEENVVYIRGKVAKIFREGDKVKVWGVDTLTGDKVEVSADLVVLAPALIPSEGTRELAKKLRIPVDRNGWFTEAHFKLRPLETVTAGVFIAGAGTFPKDINDSVSQGSGAAAKVITLFSQKEVYHEPVIAEVDHEICAGCGMCEQICVYEAVKVDPKLKKAVVNEALCEGCGACQATCPSGAIRHRNFERNQISRMIEIATEDY